MALSSSVWYVENFDGRRNEQLLTGLQSANGVESHHEWIKDINEVTGSDLKFPIISDPERKVAYLYDMVDYQDTTNVDSKGMLLYAEILRPLSRC